MSPFLKVPHHLPLLPKTIPTIMMTKLSFYHFPMYKKKSSRTKYNTDYAIKFHVNLFLFLLSTLLKCNLSTVAIVQYFKKYIRN